MIAFIDDHRGVFGGEPLMRHWFKHNGEPDLPCSGDRTIDVLRFQSCGARSGPGVGPGQAGSAAHGSPSDGPSRTAGAAMARARCSPSASNAWRPDGSPSAAPQRSRRRAAHTVERLMKVMGLQGVVRGKTVVTTNPDAAQPCPDDKVNRAFVADMPNQLWVSDFTYVSSWQGMVSFGAVLGPVAHWPLTLHHRRFRPQDCRLARLDIDDDRSRSRSNQWRADRSPFSMP
jgi:hypothetical protein